MDQLISTTPCVDDDVDDCYDSRPLLEDRNDVCNDGATYSHSSTHTSKQSPPTARVAGQTRSITATVTTGPQFLWALYATATVARTLLSAVPDAVV